MKNWIKYKLAQHLRDKIDPRDPNNQNEKEVKRFNHLSALILTKGRVKWQWHLILRKDVVKCHRCAKILRKGHSDEPELCDKCKQLLSVRDMIR